jgi:hypothetical protein
MADPACPGKELQFIYHIPGRAVPPAPPDPPGGAKIATPDAATGKNDRYSRLMNQIDAAELSIPPPRIFPEIEEIPGGEG